MPVPEPRKPSQPPQDEPATPARPTSPPAPATPPVAPQEPVGGDKGRPAVAPAPPAPYTADAAALRAADEPPDDGPRMDETVPGGRYQVGSKIVNAHGDVLGDAPSPAKKK